MSTKTWIVVKRTKSGTLTASTHPHEHISERLAKIEAERLAKDNPGVAFLVFEGKSTSEAKITPVQTETMPDLAAQNAQAKQASRFEPYDGFADFNRRYYFDPYTGCRSW